MRVFLAGGTGLVGRNIREARDADAHHLIAPPRAELNLFDANAVQRYFEIHRPDLVIHAAGRVGGIQANMRHPVAFLVENLDIGRNLVVGAMRAGIPRFLNLGTCCMYPRDAPNPLKETDLLSGTLEPTNEAYAIAKIATARLCQYIGQENPSFSYKTLIPSNVYGRYDNFSPNHGHMVPTVIAKLHAACQHAASEIDIWGDGTARREYLYAGDLANAVWRAVEHFENCPDIMNIGPGIDHSINEYYKIIAEIVGFSGRLVHDLSKPTGMQAKLLDVSRMRNWGFVPRHSLRDGIRNAYAYYLSTL